MSITYDVTQDLRYLEGKELGVELGVEKNKKEMIVKLLKEGSWSLQKISDFVEVDIDTIIAISNEMQSK